MIAQRIPTILPKMTEEEALEVMRIHSVANQLKNKSELISERPFRAPHHNASTNAVIGGGTYAHPREISLHIKVSYFWMKLLNLLEKH